MFRLGRLGLTPLLTFSLTFVFLLQTGFVKGGFLPKMDRIVGLVISVSCSFNRTLEDPVARQICALLISTS